ncbi:MAG: ABC transporter ATP-binding protein [Firmicutes bacterium]|nr:ABC transporter ATP-binding protein [Bacillota bacterium]
MLELKKVSVSYGAVGVLERVSLHVLPGEIVGLVGPNGAGKTTVLRAAAGLVRVCAGAVLFQGRNITPLKPGDRVRLGLVYAREGARVAPEMTVLENLLVGAYLRWDRRRREAALGEIFQLFPCLDKKKSQPAGSLSGGEKQMLLIGRALMARPRVLLLDEPFFGLSAAMRDVLLKVIRRIHGNGVTVVFAEHDLKIVGELADRVYGLCNGSVVFAGTAEQLTAAETLERVYA